MNALANPEVGKFINEYFVSSYQKVATFKIVGNQKQGGNVAAYFCAPDGRVLHAVAGPVDAQTMLREAKWVVEIAKKGIEASKGDGAKFKEIFRKAHAAKLRDEAGIVVEAVIYDPPEPMGENDALTFRDPTGRLRAVIFDPRVEMELRRNTQNNKLNLDAGQQEALVMRLVTELRTASQRGYEVALLCDTSMRRAVRYVLSRAIGDLAVLAYQEMPADVLIEPVAILRPEDLQGGPGTVAKMFG